MAYTDFTLDIIEEKFGIKNQVKPLFANIQPVSASEWLLTTLNHAQDLPIRSEKARSEWLVSPILTELRNRNDKYFTIYSGDTLNVDEQKGLRGECDFILSKNTGTFNISFPIFQIVEAKKNDLELGVAQCAAQLIGAKIFNQSKGVELKYIYGCVTTGREWMFLCLNDDLLIDQNTYNITQLEVLLGVFQKVIDHYKAIL
jgi:hypothetical protein